jgi:hypothetical protein
LKTGKRFRSPCDGGSSRDWFRIGRNLQPKWKMPDFIARLKKIHGAKVISAEEAEAILDENRGRF